MERIRPATTHDAQRVAQLALKVTEELRFNQVLERENPSEEDLAKNYLGKISNLHLPESTDLIMVAEYDDDECQFLQIFPKS